MTKLPSLKSAVIPTVFEEERNGVRSYYDLFSRLLKDRIVFITGAITEDLANLIIAELIYLERENPKEDIQVYIQSPGGSVNAGLAIYDTFQYLKPDIVTIGMGLIASMASVLLASGTNGKRFILPHTQVMIHQPWTPRLSNVKTTDLLIYAEQSKKEKERLQQILANHTKQPFEKIERDTERDYWINAEESVQYGIVDKVLKS
ncbi:MAG: ATP-dependent Clp protease proteolytic subunit [Candidatus Dojkabacteria bacterium]|nr:MAG: ATP-dependent Clp protease proteolytic subunit [Candidatus Dojkabacteria bacterium]